MNLNRGSPIGFSGSGIWSGFSILEDKGSKILDCSYQWNMGFENFTKQDAGKFTLKNRDSGSQVIK